MRNKQLAEKFRQMNCIVCFRKPSEGDHIKNFSGDSEKDIEENIWPLCRSCHIEKHSRGLKAFVEKHNLTEELLNRGFWFDGEKWRKHF